MATPIISFNNSTGSDTAASGSGGTNLSGTSASYSGSVVTLDGSPDLSGVLTDGSEIFWLQTDSGRQFFPITGKDDGLDQLTLGYAPAGTSTGLTWGYGGKRATIDNVDSRVLFQTDWTNDWVVELEYTGANYTLSTTGLSMQVTAQSDSVTIKGTGVTRPIIEQTSATHCLNLGSTGSFTPGLLIEFLQFQNSHASGGNGVYFGYKHNVTAKDCIFGDATNQLTYAFFEAYGTTNRLHIIDCEIKDCINSGIYMIRGCAVYRSWIHDNAQYGADIGGNGSEQFWVFDSIIADNGLDGINMNTQGGYLIIRNCVIDGNTGDGIDTVAGSSMPGIMMNNTIISNNGGYGFNTDITPFTYTRSRDSDGNLWYNNTSGDVLNYVKGDNDISGSDPDFTDAANGDYSISATSPAKGAGYPTSSRTIGANQSSTTSYVDIGAAQRQESAGGATRLINGGLIS